jgi:hypothetical protein
MNCKKCKNNLDNDSKFCTKCGEKVQHEIKESKKTEEKIKTKENKDINGIKNHIEFLGYSTEFDESEKDRITLIGRHSDKPNLICSSSKDGIIFLTSSWTGLKEINSIEQYKVLNKLHTNSTFSQFVIKDDGGLNIHSTYLGEYDKKRFGQFLDIFLIDINRALNDESFIKLITK